MSGSRPRFTARIRASNRAKSFEFRNDIIFDWTFEIIESPYYDTVIPPSQCLNFVSRVV